MVLAGSQPSWAQSSSVLETPDPHQRFDELRAQAAIGVVTDAVFEQLLELRSDIKLSGSGAELMPVLDDLLNKLWHQRHRVQAPKRPEFSPVQILIAQIQNASHIRLTDISTPAELARFQKHFRQRVLDLAGTPSQVVPLNPEVVSREEREQYWIEELVFTAEPGVLVPAFICIPKDIEFPAPAVLCLHQHAGEYYQGASELLGRNGANPDQALAHELAERGYVTLAIDARGFGRRADDEGELDYYGLALGRPLLGQLLWDDLRSIDYLLSRPEVDDARIGVIGHSMGGVRSLFLAGVDSRIRAAVVSGAYTSYRVLMGLRGGNQPPSTWLPGLLQYGDMEHVLALAIPRPMLLVAAMDDETVPWSPAQQGLTEVRQLYTVAGKSGRLNVLLSLSPQHRFEEKLRNDAYNWLDRKLRSQ